MQVANLSQKQKLLSFDITFLKQNDIQSSTPAPNQKAEQNSSLHYGYERLSSIIYNYLQHFNFTLSTYYALVEILLERVSPNTIHSNPVHLITGEDIEKPKTSQQQSYSSYSSQILFKDPSILPTIFDLLCSSGNALLQQRALEDLLYLLNKERRNRSLFIQQERWAAWLLGILAANSTNPEQQRNSSPLRTSQVSTFNICYLCQIETNSNHNLLQSPS